MLMILAAYPVSIVIGAFAVFEPLDPFVDSPPVRGRDVRRRLPPVFVPPRRHPRSPRDPRPMARHRSSSSVSHLEIVITHARAVVLA